MNDDFIIDPKTGFLVYTSTESVLSDAESNLMRIIAARPPFNEANKELAQQVHDIEKSGRIIEIPSN